MSRRYSEAVGAPEAPTTPSRSSTDCVANGCPLPGVYRISNEVSVCCAHDGEDAGRWGAITARVRNRDRLWRAMLSMQNAESGTLVDSLAEDTIANMGGPRFESREGQPRTLRNYASQIRAQLLTECRGEKKAPPIPPARSSGESFARVGDVLGEVEA